MSSTSLYEATPQTGTVSSTNLTSLYSNTTNFTTGVVTSAVYSVNGGTGVTVDPTTGNVVVSIGQDVSTTANVQFANVTATGNLSNNYFTLANSVGTLGQVLTTDGSGNTSWTTVSSLGLVNSVSGSGAGITVSPTTGNVVVTNTGVTSIVAGTNISVSSATGAVTVNATDTNTTYQIASATATGGANLNLVGSDSTTDSVKFASGTGITVSSTDANTITITNNATAGTTYAISSASTTGGANLTLTGSDSSTDSVAYKGSGATTVTSTDANTITISSTDTNTTYNIDASATTGGANLNLTGSDSTTDTVKFAAGTNMNIVRTDANTITISTVADNIPDGTAKGQVLYWDGTAWTANNVITSAASANRLTAVYQNSTAGPSSALFVRKDYGATAYSSANNDGVGINFSTTSNSQGLSNYGFVEFEYSATDPQFGVFSSTDNFTTNNQLTIIDKLGQTLYGPNLTLNYGQTGAPTVDAFFIANRGTSPDANIRWNEGTQRWQTTVDNTTYLNIPNQNLDTTSAVNFNSVTLDTRSAIDTFTQTTTSTSTIALATSTRTAMTVLVTAVQGSNTHVVNATVLRNGSSAMLTTYGEMYNNTSLVSFTADVSAGAIRLLITPTSATSTVFNAVRTSLD